MSKNSLTGLVHDVLGLDSDIEALFLGVVEDKRPGALSYLENKKFLPVLNNNPNIIAAFVKSEMLAELRSSITPIVVEKPAASFYTVHNEYCKRFLKYPDSKISRSAQIGLNVYIAPQGVTIGENVKIHNHATILEGVELGDDSSIGPGCVVGAEGFQLYDDLKGVKRMVIHDGLVKIGRNVDILANCVVAKGLMGHDTVIGDESKIDALITISHCVKIGKRCALAAGTCLSGSVNIGDDVWMGPQTAVSHGVTIHDRARVLLGTVVIRDVKPEAVVSGNFAGVHEKNLLLTALRNI